MSAKLIFFIFIHLVALVFFLEMLRRVNKRVDEYRLKDTKETLPFGLVRLRHVVILYVLTYVAWVVFSTILYFVFIDPHPDLFQKGGEPGIINNFEF